MTFDEVIPLILKSEGGSKITRDPDDPGGTTKYGISQRAFPHLNIEDLQEEDAKRIYKTSYWDAIGCDDLPPSLRYMAMDCAVLQGEFFSKKEIRNICAITILTPLGQLMKFRNERSDRFKLSSKYEKYQKGWNSRLEFVFDVCKIHIEDPKFSYKIHLDIMPDFLKFNMIDDAK